MKLTNLEHGNRLPEGSRDKLLFLHAVALSWFAQPDAIESEILSVGRLITDFSDAEILATMSPVISRRNMADQGQKIVFGGREVDPRYFFRAATLRDWVGHDLVSKYADQLRALAPAEVIQERKKLRDASRWQDSYTGNGVRASNEDKRATARLMAASGTSQRAIAAELGVSQKTISLWLRPA